MKTTLCPGDGCSRASTCLRAIRFKTEPTAPNRSSSLLFESAGECFYYYEDHGKRASTEPNAANLIGAYIGSAWPMLSQFSRLWVTGSTVWRIAYAMPTSTDSDLDIFVCDWGQYSAVVNLLHGIESPAPVDRSKKAKASMPGERLHTTRGWVDVWVPSGAEVDDLMLDRHQPDPLHALRQYPPTTHAHCRIAYNPATTALLVIANEKADEQGASEYHERAAQWHIEQADRLIKIARRSA